MIQKIIDGIIAAIRTEYGKPYRIYTESVIQGLKEPCFSVMCLNPSGEREVGNRFKRFYPFMISYFPSTDEPVEECNDVCDTLLFLLSDIETDDGGVHVLGAPSGQIVDGVLHFGIQYQAFANKYKAPETGMDELITVETNVRRGE